MKTFKIIFFFTALFSSNLLFAQQYLDHTSTWKILRTGHGSTGEHEKYLTITIDGDTTIQSKVYHKLYEEGIDYIDYWTGGTGTVPIPKSLYGFIREDSSKFFQYAPYLGQDILIYDFTKAIGDSVVQDYCLDSVLSIDTVYLGTTALKRWSFGFPFNGSLMFSYIEGVGAVSALLDYYCVFTGGGSTLLCYEKQGEQLIVTPGYSCSVFNALPQVKKEAHSLDVQIYPNPTVDKVFIRVKEATNDQLLLYNANGQLLETQSIKEQLTELNLNDYPQGMYWIKVKTGEEVFTYKAIKI